MTGLENVFIQRLISYFRYFVSKVNAWFASCEEAHLKLSNAPNYLIKWQQTFTPCKAGLFWLLAFLHIK